MNRVLEDHLDVKKSGLEERIKSQFTLEGPI